MSYSKLLQKGLGAALVFTVVFSVLTPVMGVEIARESFERFPDVLVETLAAGGGLFSYTTNSDSNWLVRAGSLQYTDGAAKSPPTLGHKMVWEGDSGGNRYCRQNVNWNYPGGGTPSVYRSFLVKCTELPVGESYIANFRGSGHDASGRVWIRPDGVGGIELGLTASSGGGTASIAWATPPVTIGLNTVNMIVVRMDLNPGDGDDVTHLFVNPLLDTAEPAPDITANYVSGNELLQPVGTNNHVHDGDVDNLVWKRDNNPEAGLWEWDDDRFGTTWADVTNTGPVSTADVTPPEISDHEPDANIEVIGPLTLVSYLYNSGLAPASVPVASDCTVNGSPATTMVNLNPTNTAGRYLFSGFTPVPAGTTATISLRAGVGVDVAGNAFEGDWYQVAVVADPGDVAYMIDHFHYADGSNLNPVQEWVNANNNTAQHEVRNFDTAGDGGSSSLQYPGLPNLSQGGRLLVKDGGNDDTYRHAPHPFVIRGLGKAAYGSFLIKMTTAPNATHDAWIRFRANGSPNSTHGRLVIENMQIGVRMENASTDVLVPPENALVLGQTHLVVIRYTMVIGPDNDTMEVWVDPPLGGTPPPAHAITTTDPATEVFREVNPAGGLRGINMRFRGGGDAGAFETDELRFGPTWASVTTDIALDTAAPVIDTEFPTRDTSVLGAITHVEVNFDEFVTGVTASMLTVNGAAATSITRNLPPRIATADGSYVFYGFTPVTAPGTVNIALNGPGIVDGSGNAFAGDTWSITLAAPPEDGLLLYEPFDYPNESALADNNPWTTPGFTRAPAENIKVSFLEGNPSSSNLFYPNLPQSTGGRVLAKEVALPVISTLFARLPLAMPVVGEGSSLYLSFLYAGVGETGDGEGEYFAFIQSANSDTPAVGRIDSSGVNDPDHTLSIIWTTPAYSPRLTEIGSHPIDEPVLIVMKITIVPGRDNDTVTMWVNPDLGSTTERLGGMPSTVEPATFEDLNPAHGFLEFVIRTDEGVGEFSIDELRIGTTWASVTPTTSLAPPKAGAYTWMLY